MNYSIKFYYLFLLFLICGASFGQTDTEFWFVAPEVTNEHGDSPVFLRFSSYESAATVTISQPATPGFSPIVVQIPANSTRSVDLSSRLLFIESSSPDKIESKGILITSSSRISAYYEVLGYESQTGYVNTDIFSLKGENALGRYFLTPFQTFWPNENANLKNAWSSFNIVATKDNTTIYIIPKTSVIGHTAGVMYSVKLNRGQTYTGRATGKNGIDRPSGTRIISDKPIAITVSDDSVLEGSGYDLIGDQIVPLNHLGSEYIFNKVGNTPNEKGFIIASQNNTLIYLNGSTTPTASINIGDTYFFDIPQPSIYIKTSAPAYAFHVSGNGDELAGALLPEINCTGSRTVSFNRSTSENFLVSIIAHSGSEGNFTINGDNSLITASDFVDVPGTNGMFKSAVKSFDENTIVPNNSYNIANTESDFQLGIINGSPDGPSFRYGYFSSFGKLELGPDHDICPGESVTLNAGNEKDRYLWSTGSSEKKIQVSEPGKYWVRVEKGICVLSDTVEVIEHSNPLMDLGPDRTFCSNETINIYAPAGYSKYTWSTGEISTFITPAKSGTYSVTVTNAFGCSSFDEISVTKYAQPTPQIFFEKDEKSLCKDSMVLVKTQNIYQSYLWQNADTSFYTYAPTASKYSLTVVDENNCSGTVDTVLDCSPYIKVFNLLTPNQDGLNDYFVIEGIHDGKYALEIYNRWGSRIFYSQAYDNNCSPENIPDGIYYYSLNHSEGKNHIKGWIQVIRTN